MIDPDALDALIAAAKMLPLEAESFTRYPDDPPDLRWRIFLRGHPNPATNSRDCDWTKAEAAALAVAVNALPELLRVYRAALAWHETRGSTTRDAINRSDALAAALDATRSKP